jgi:hypothetical protein
MVEAKIEQFTKTMEGLLLMEREAELEESSALLSKFSFKVCSDVFYMLLKGIGTFESCNNEAFCQKCIDRCLWKSSTPPRAWLGQESQIRLTE